MNKIVLLGFILSFALAGCSREEPSREAPEPEASTEEVAPEAPAEAVTGDAEEEAQPELVEESAAEPDEAQAEKQPILLARETEAATVAAPPRAWSYSEGQHYHRLVPTQPTVGGANKVEIARYLLPTGPSNELNNTSPNAPLSIKRASRATASCS